MYLRANYSEWHLVSGDVLLMLEVCIGLSQCLYTSLSSQPCQGDVRGTLVGHELPVYDEEREGSTF